MWCHHWWWVWILSTTGRSRGIKQSMGMQRRPSTYYCSTQSVRIKNLTTDLFQIDWNDVDPSCRTWSDRWSSLLHRSVFTPCRRRELTPKAFLWYSWHENPSWQWQTTCTHRCGWLSWIRRPYNNSTSGEISGFIGSLKENLNDQANWQGLHGAVIDFMQSLIRDRYEKTFEKWIERMPLCVNNHSDCFEHPVKWSLNSLLFLICFT